MKKAIPAIAVILCATILSSCSVNKESFTSPKVESENAAGAVCFIQMNDGSTKQFNSLKLVTGILKTPYLLADNKEIINAKDIMAYQDKNVYAVSEKMLTSNRTGFVAVEALPGFAVKVVSGKVNVYCRKYYNGANTVDEYFLQTGNDGYIVSYSKEVLKSMLKENAQALEFFNSKTKDSPKTKKMLITVEMYNNSQMITKN